MYHCEMLPFSIYSQIKNTVVKNPPVDANKDNSGSQQAVPVNAWLLAQGSYNRQNVLLIQTSTSQAAAIIVGMQYKAWHAS